MISHSPCRFYAIIIIRITDSFDRNNPPDQDVYNTAGPYDRMAGTPQEAYITAAWSDPTAVPDIFTVGDESITTVGGVMYENVGLSSNTDYTYIIRLDVKSDISDIVSIMC